MYAKIENGLPVEWPVREFQIRNAVNASLPVALKAEDVAPFGFELYAESDKPAFNELVEKVEERAPVKQGGTWLQAWAVVELYSPAEREQVLAKAEADRLEAEYQAKMSMTVTPRQAKLALLQAGLLDDIEAAIAQADRAVQIEWEYATEFKRTWPTLLAMQTALGLTDQQLDNLFTLAATL